MKEFDHIVQDPCGLHARPAGLLADFVRNHPSDVQIEKKGRRVNAKNLMLLMGLHVVYGDILHVMVDGPESEKTAKELADFLLKHL